jgi:hypothetical protein
MKIDTNIENLNTGRVHRQSPEHIQKELKSDTVQEKVSQSAENLAKKRTNYDAIIITQIAQSFFQKAVLLSSTLGNVVSEALTSGKIKQAELSDALSEIRSSLNEIGGLSSKSSASAPQNFASVYQYTGMQIDIPQINTEINEVNQMAGNLSSGVLPDLKKIDRITDSLSSKASAVDNLFRKFAGSLPINEKGLSSKLSLEKGTELLNNTADLIGKNPKSALYSQGNINHETVKNLL